MTPDVAAIAAGKRVLVCGGRAWSDEGAVWDALDRIAPAVVIQGGAPGADAMAAAWAFYRCAKCEDYRADWRTHGPAAGPIRNQRMIDEGKPDLVVAFPGGAGTADMVRRAKAAGLRVIEIGKDMSHG